MRSWKGQAGVQGWFFARHGEEVFSRSPLGLLASSWDWRWTSTQGNTCTSMKVRHIAETLERAVSGGRKLWQRPWA